MPSMRTSPMTTAIPVSTATRTGTAPQGDAPATSGIASRSSSAARTARAASSSRAPRIPNPASIWSPEAGPMSPPSRSTISAIRRRARRTSSSSSSSSIAPASTSPSAKLSAITVTRRRSRFSATTGAGAAPAGLVATGCGGGSTAERALRARRLQEQRRVMPEDPLLERSERRGRHEPELLVEGPPQILQRRQRVRVAAAAIQREHELRPRALAERLAGDERLELGRHGGVVPERQLGVDAILDAVEAQLRQTRRLEHGERLAELRERLAAPEGERVAEQRGRPCARRPRRARARPASRNRSNRARSTDSGSTTSA